MVYILVFIVLVLADQITKAIAYAFYGSSVTVIPGYLGFEAIPLNEGMSFGWLSGKEWAQPLLIGLTAVAVLAFLVAFLRISKKRRFLRVALLVLMAGAVGNLIDRAVDQGVRDFIYMNLLVVEFHNNVADLEVTVGAILFLLALLFVDKDAIFRFGKRKEEEELKNAVSELEETGREADNDIGAADRSLDKDKKNE